ncbi:hypothetical protein EDD37DRAFT_647191 [Exophiala viscosa]|uniref:uncharacterized protein n=1 Tax=Exophiala viscosa TaxID=2486360 RepID=UPI00219612E2|nr:hypothetical protein EDD37DRAFT_647191 [Exophiala viscosa]
MSVNEHYFPIGSTLNDQALGGVVLSLHVNLARLMSTLMADLYVADGSLEASYLSKITQGLVKLAAFADQLDRTVKERLTSSVGSLPKGATQLLRDAHHKAPAAEHPPKAIKVRFLASHEIEDAFGTFAESTENLRGRGLAHAENLADTFLPFDLEYCFSAASVLVLLDDVLHCTAVEGGAKDLALQLLEDMASRGSAPAKFRRAQLERLRVASKHFWEDAERRERHHVVTQTAANTSGSACATTQEPHRRISPSTSTNPIQLASVSDERPTHQYPAEELMAQGQVIQCPDLEPNGMSSFIDEIFVDDALPEFDLFATYGDWMSTDAL